MTEEFKARLLSWIAWGLLIAAPSALLHGLSDLRVGQLTLLLEPQNFSNSSHGNPLGRHTDLLVQKRSQRDSRFIESPHSASPATGGTLVGHLERHSEHLERQFRHARKIVQHPAETAFNINLRRNAHNTS